MAYEFTKLSEVPVADTVSDECSVLVEDCGDIKRTAKSNIGKEQVQADWNENDSSSPAYILNKPESLSGGVTWFVASGSETSLGVRNGKDWNSGSAVTGTELVNAFESGICRCKVTVVSCCGKYESTGTITSYRQFTLCGAQKVTAIITGYSDDGRITNLKTYGIDL